MLRPSTAPRWNTHTRTFPPARRPGRRIAYAALPRKSGSRPRLTSDSAPAFTNTRRDMSAGLLQPQSLMVASLLLEVGTA